MLLVIDGNGQVAHAILPFRSICDALGWPEFIALELQHEPVFDAIAMLGVEMLEDVAGRILA